MSEPAQPPDDLERMLAASRELRGRYREASAEEPASALDDAIRAQARRAVGARPRSAGSPFSSTWRVPLSLAAVLVLSVSVTVMVTRHDQHLPSVERSDARTSAPAAQPPAAAPAPNSPLADERDHAPPLNQDSSRVTEAARSAAPNLEKERPQSPQRSAPADELAPPALKKQAQPFPVAPMEQSPPAQKAEGAADLPPKATDAPGLTAEPARESEAAGADTFAKRDRAAGEAPAELKPSTANAVQAQGKLKAQEAPSAREERADVQRQQAPAPAAVPESPPPAAAASVAPWESNPQQWLRHIDRLVRDHRMSEARDSFKAFRQRYPSYPLPSDFPLREP